MSGFFCGPTIYEYGGWRFEFGMMTGPWPVKIDGELYRRAGDKFFDEISPFLKMTDSERMEYKIGGGCVEL